jgi:hypothetical protein
MILHAFWTFTFITAPASNRLFSLQPLRFLIHGGAPAVISPVGETLRRPHAACCNCGLMVADNIWVSLRMENVAATLRVHCGVYNHDLVKKHQDPMQLAKL